MKKLKVNLDDKSKRILGSIISNESISKRNRRKAEVILLKSKGDSNKTIHEKTGLCKRTIIYYITNYNKDEMRFIHKNEYKKSILKQGGKIEEEFQNNPPSSYKEATERIEKLFDLHVSVSACRRYLNKHKIYTKRSIAFHRNRGSWKNT